MLTAVAPHGPPKCSLHTLGRDGLVRCIHAFSTYPQSDKWAQGGLTYAGYNVIGAVVILPVMRHMTRARDAGIAGLLAGPLAMLPALVFFVCMVAFHPEIQSESLPSDFLLSQLHAPTFSIIYQFMILAALLESGSGGVHAINERAARAYERRTGGPTLSARARLVISGTVLTGSVFVAGRFGLVALIAQGYQWLSFAFLAIYILPLMTVGVWRLARPREAALIGVAR